MAHRMAETHRWIRGVVVDEEEVGSSMTLIEVCGKIRLVELRTTLVRRPRVVT
jgi:hypothetical protein